MSAWAPAHVGLRVSVMLHVEGGWDAQLRVRSTHVCFDDSHGKWRTVRWWMWGDSPNNPGPVTAQRVDGRVTRTNSDGNAVGIWSAAIVGRR